MKLLSSTQKQETYGGAFASGAWIAMIGGGLLLASVTSLVTTLATQGQPESSNSATTSGRKGNALIRMSAVPSRSSVSFWV